MADIELVIKIPDKAFKNLQFFKDGSLSRPEIAVKYGISLPKGHGKLKDADELYSIFKKNCDAYNIDNLSFISDMDMNFDLAPTIIEADKTESEGET